MKKQLFAAAFFALICSIASCKKKDEIKDHDVLILALRDPQNNQPVQPFLWKNGTISDLSASMNYGRLYVDDGNIYIPTSQGYLKNGVMVDINGASLIRNVVVNGGDIYVAGACTALHNPAAYWKNGQMVQLVPDSIDQASAAEFIAVSGNDVYVGGQLGDSVVYWKNGILNVVGKGYINGMAVVGSDVHIIAITGVQSTYWKNGTVVQLYAQDNTITPFVLYALRSYNNDVYITGITFNYIGNPAYWKNNQPIGIMPANMIPNDVAADGDNVYVTAYTQISTAPYSVYNAFLWKNGTIDTIGMDERPLSIAIGH